MAMTQIEREKRLGELAAAIAELEPAVYRLRLNQNFNWLPSLLTALRAVGDVLQDEIPKG